MSEAGKCKENAKRMQRGRGKCHKWQNHPHRDTHAKLHYHISRQILHFTEYQTVTPQLARTCENFSPARDRVLPRNRTAILYHILKRKRIFLLLREIYLHLTCCISWESIYKKTRNKHYKPSHSHEETSFFHAKTFGKFRCFRTFAALPCFS